jgi:hypothetical protein
MTTWQVQQLLITSQRLASAVAILFLPRGLVIAAEYVIFRMGVNNISTILVVYKKEGYKCLQIVLYV